MRQQVNKAKKSLKWLRHTLFAFLIFFTTCSLFRIYYFGSFIDGIILDFLFGVSKYFVYLLLLTIAVVSFFSNQKVFKLLTNRKTVLWYIIVTTLILLITSLVYYYQKIKIVDGPTPNALVNGYFTESWKSIMWNSLPWENKVLSTYVHPGFFWLVILIIINYAPITFIWLSLVVLIIGILVYIGDKVNIKFATKIVGFFHAIRTYFFRAKTPTNLTKPLNIVQPTKIENSVEKVIKNIATTDMIPYSLIAKQNQKYPNFLITNFIDIEEDNSVINKKYMKEAINNLATFFEKKDLDCSFIECQLGPSSLRILFSSTNPSKYCAVSDGDKSWQIDLRKALNTNLYSILTNDNWLIVDLPLKKSNRISFKKTLEKLPKNENELCALVGVNSEFEPIKLNLSNSPIVLVCGDDNSGKDQMLMQIILSILTRYSPNEILLAVIDNQKSSLNELDRVKNTIDKIATSTTMGIELIEKIIFEMKYRVKTLNEYHCENVNEFNEKQLDFFFANLLVVINDVESFVEINEQYFLHFLKLIQKYSKKLNVFCILSAKSITPQISSDVFKRVCKNVIALKLKTTLESELLIKKTIIAKLFGNGDFYYIHDFDNPKIQRGQCTYINNDIVNQIIRKINNY